MYRLKGNNSKKFALNFMLFSVVFILVSAILYFGAQWLFAVPTLQNIDSQMPYTVIIDAGHGGEDGGAVSKSGLLEKDINLEISSNIYDMLRLNGINVIMTRTEDKMLYDRYENYSGHKKAFDLRARLDIAKETENPIFVSIHINSFPQEKYSGLQVYYSKNTESSKELADIIQSNVKSLIQKENERQTKPATSNIYLLDRIESTAVLVECGFISNEAEAALLSDANYRKKLAFVISTSISEYIYSLSA